MTSGLQMKKVIQVACGSHHSLALTDDGEVGEIWKSYVVLNILYNTKKLFIWLNHIYYIVRWNNLKCEYVPRGV